MRQSHIQIQKQEPGKTNEIKLDVNTTIKKLEQEQTHKHLGINEADGVKNATNSVRQFYRKIQEIQCNLTRPISNNSPIKHIIFTLKIFDIMQENSASM